MIVRSAHGTLHLITQPDHAHLAARIMEHSVALASSPRRERILHAIAEHDNGWAEPDAAVTVNPETGGVADFVSAPLGVRHGIWPRGVARLADDPWAAALVAEHAITVYDRFRTDAAWAPFFADMEFARAAMVRASGLSHDALLADYPFVRLADLISLTFCTGWSEEQRLGEWSVRRVGDRVVVVPDPFGGTTVPFAIEAKAIPDRAYRSDDDLREAIGGAASITLRGEAAGARLA